MEPRRRNPLRRYPTAVCISVLHFEHHPVQDESVEQPWGICLHELFA